MEIGIDLGATKVEYLILDNNGSEILRQREKSAQTYQSTITQLEKIIKVLSSKHNQVLNVGLCHPGSINEKDKIINANNSPWLNDKTLLIDLKKKVSNKIIAENDANCFALSEAIDGAAKNAYSVFGIILGSGTGGGLVINKEIIKGKNFLGGEWGHNFLPGFGLNEKNSKKIKPQYQFTIEQYLSGKGLEKIFKQEFKKKLSANEIFMNKSNDIKIKNFIKNYKDRLARSLAMIINVLDPDTIVFGGGVSNEIKSLNEIKNLTSNYLKKVNLKTVFTHPAHGDSSGVRGAALLARNI